MLSNSLCQKMIITLSHGVIPLECCKGGSLVHGFQHPIVPWLSMTIAASPPPQFLMFDKHAVREVFPRARKASCVHYSGDDFERSNHPNPGKTFLEAYQLVVASQFPKPLLVLLFALTDRAM
jgi:hypothetical protein